jgi:hypothetical protein
MQIILPSLRLFKISSDTSGVSGRSSSTAVLLSESPPLLNYLDAQLSMVFRFTVHEGPIAGELLKATDIVKEGHSLCRPKVIFIQIKLPADIQDFIFLTVRPPI